jgi:hypothetical protein
MSPDGFHVGATGAMGDRSGQRGFETVKHRAWAPRRVKRKTKKAIGRVAKKARKAGAKMAKAAGKAAKAKSKRVEKATRKDRKKMGKDMQKLAHHAVDAVADALRA